MKIWHISDTHGMHDLLIEPTGVDCVIFSGDCSNVKDTFINEREVIKFLEWFSKLKAPHKIFVAGNHDTSIEKNLITKRNMKDIFNITYLENDYVIIDGMKIWGSPFTPTFGIGWAFNRSRNTISRLWEHIPDDTDILVIHGPAKGILDLTENRDRTLEQVGCSALRKRIFKIKPKFFMFGHLHDNGNIKNSGVFTISELDTVFSNATVVADRNRDAVVSNGNVFDII